jgi:uncharacterized protein with von Willebrand factor type A (vWA) domain
MRERLLGFVDGLRARGVEVSVAETLDALAAVAAAGVERAVLREALAATLVKDEADRPAFDALFDIAFPLGGGEAAAGGRRRRRGGGGAGGAGGSGRGTGAGSTPGGAGGERGRSVARRADGHPASDPSGEIRTADRRPRAATPAGNGADAAGRDGAGREGRDARRRRLLALPFAAFTARDVVEARAVVRELGRRLRGRLARRQRRGRRGQVDVRRTIRAALATGGTPFRTEFRRRRPAPPDLVALCDLSGSVAAASELCLGLLAPAAEAFRRVHLFAYVDRPCPVSVEDGHVAPGEPLDLHARSDFGRVLAELLTHHGGTLRRGTLVLVLGDARNNRLPPRVDLWRQVRERVGRIVWLVPEPRARWDTGDSVLRLYAPLCDAVVECLDPGTLVHAVRAAL